MLAGSALFVMTAVILGQIAMPLAAQAANPQFNIFTPYVHTQTFNRDYFLLDAKNDTKGTTWGFPVAADAGDVITFYTYYHNGVNGSIANNTTMKVNLPSGQSTTQNVTASLWADNALNATPANPISQSLPVNLSSSQSLQYISGSAKWFPNQASSLTAAPTAFPSGQTGDQLFTSGINLGDINGCWEFSGAIIWQAKVGNTSSVLTPELTISKMVRNQTQGQSAYANSVNANPNDQLNFQIQIQNISNTALSNVIVRDVLPSQINFVSGSTQNNGTFVSDGITSGNINIGSIAQGATANITFNAAVISGASAQTATNIAYARADQVSERNDTATVYVGQSYNQGNLNISKTVRNITVGTNMQSSVNANVGDRILFLIQVSTPVNSAQINNIRVWDIMPAGLSYISGTARIDNAYTNDGIVSGGINLGAMSANQNKSINFEATVNSNFYGSQTLTNYGYVSADNVGQRSDFAQVIVGNVIYQIPTPTPIPVYTVYNPTNLTKYVDNLTSPNGTRSDNTARLGDILKYTLTYTNNTGAAVNNIQIFDVLPSYTVFISADNNGYYTDSSVNKVTWNIGTLNPGATATVSYQARVENVPENNFVITNSAAIQSANFGLINSNEVHTTVQLGVVKGAYIKAVTGSDDLPRNMAVSLMLSLWGIFLIYLYTEYALVIDWKNLKFRFIVWRIRVKEKLI